MRYGFLALMAYLCAMAVAHFFGIKLPILFIYFDTPFFSYQDKIIAFAVTAYIALVWLASRTREAAPTTLILLGLTVLGLSSVNLSGALAEVLEPGQSTALYWAQTAAIGAYWLILVVVWRRQA